MLVDDYVTFTVLVEESICIYAVANFDYILAFGWYINSAKQFIQLTLCRAVLLLVW